ncbi:MAG: MOSC domain-containing protein [Acidimicrobiales bacterium]|nr:MOSC domain-containing protein [Acidimicrobiales bacterium]
MEMYTGMSDEDTPLFDWPGPPGRWVDLADAHWLTTASLTAAAGLHPDGTWDVRRFRPTALFAVADEGFAEDTWSQVAAGPVQSEVLMPTMRCSMPSRAQPGLERDGAIGTTLRDRHDNNLGLYAKITERGTIAVGDEVRAQAPPAA